MKYIIALLGALCVVGGTHAAVNITAAVVNATNAGLAGINASNAVLNSTLYAGDKLVNLAMCNLNTTLTANVTALIKKFVNYTTLSTGTLSNIITTLNSLTVPSLVADPNLSNLYSSLYSAAQQVAASLVTSAANMSVSASNCNNDFSSQCATKYLANLTAASLNVSRFGACLANETARITIIATNMSASINTSLATSQSMFNLTGICTIPTPAQLNLSSPPSAQCISQFFSSFPSAVPTALTYPNGLSMLTSGVQSRVQRCYQIITADIGDQLSAINTAYANCLLTGS